MDKYDNLYNFDIEIEIEMSVVQWFVLLSWYVDQINSGCKYFGQERWTNVTYVGTQS